MEMVELPRMKANVLKPTRLHRAERGCMTLNVSFAVSVYKVHGPLFFAERTVIHSLSWYVDSVATNLASTRQE